MSREVMEKCLEEAAALFVTYKSHALETETGVQCVVAIACTLYAERCRHIAKTTVSVPSVWIGTPSTEIPQTTWSSADEKPPSSTGAHNE